MVDRESPPDDEGGTRKQSRRGDMKALRRLASCARLDNSPWEAENLNLNALFDTCTANANHWHDQLNASPHWEALKQAFASPLGEGRPKKVPLNHADRLRRSLHKFFQDQMNRNRDEVLENASKILHEVHAGRAVGEGAVPPPTVKHEVAVVKLEAAAAVKQKAAAAVKREAAVAVKHEAAEAVKREAAAAESPAPQQPGPPAVDSVPEIPPAEPPSQPPAQPAAPPPLPEDPDPDPAQVAQKALEADRKRMFDLLRPQGEEPHRYPPGWQTAEQMRLWDPNKWSSRDIIAVEKALNKRKELEQKHKELEQKRKELEQKQAKLKIKPKKAKPEKAMWSTIDSSTGEVSPMCSSYYKDGCGWPCAWKRGLSDDKIMCRPARKT